MSVPTRQEAARLLRELEPPAWLVEHSSAVAEVASYLVRRAAEHGTQVDPAIVEAAALLHDIDKLLPAEDLARALGHGKAGAAWLAGRGYPELGPSVANHPATRLADDDVDAWLISATPEELIVAYADKRAAQDVVTLDERFADWLLRHPNRAAAIEASLDRARALEIVVCRLAQLGPVEVRRASWVAEALQGATAAAR